MLKRFPLSSVVQPTAVVHAGAVIGADCRVEDGCELGAEVRLADGVTLGRGVRIAGRVTLGKGVRIGAGSLLIGPITIAPAAVLAAEVRVGVIPAAVLPIERYETLIGTHIGRRCRLGRGVEALRGLFVAEHVLARAGSIIARHAPAYALVSGCPARVEQYLCPRCKAALRVETQREGVVRLACPACPAVHTLLPRQRYAESLSHLPPNPPLPQWEDAVEMG